MTARASSRDSGSAGRRLRRSLPLRPTARGLLFALGGVLVAAAIVWCSLVPALAPFAPHLSVALRPTNPAGVIAYAQNALTVPEPSPQTSPEKPVEAAPPGPRVALDDLRTMLQASLATQPLDARVFSLLGLIAQRDGDIARATALMKVAAGLSPHETIALNWLMLERFSAKDYPAAAHDADLLLKGGTQLLEFALPVLARMSETADAEPSIEALLAAQPDWRGVFFYNLNDVVADPRTPLRLLLSLKDTAAPPTQSEIGTYLAFLMNHKLVELAYAAWLQLLPPEQLESVGNIYDGSFRYRIANTPFDWHIPVGVNYAAGLAPRPGATGKLALNVEFGDGRVEFQDITQMIRLKPGSYRFKGAYTGSVIGPRGLQWAVECLSRETLGESAMIVGRFAQWQTFDAALVVPPTCATQIVRLRLAARSASEQLVTGSIWFDDLSIVRAEPPPAPVPAIPGHTDTKGASPVPLPTALAPASPTPKSPGPAAPAVAPRAYKPAASRESVGAGRTRSSR